MNTTKFEVKVVCEATRRKIAKFLFSQGIKPKVSSGICGGLTYGYGKLDPNGYWDYMLKIE